MQRTYGTTGQFFAWGEGCSLKTIGQWGGHSHTCCINS